MARLKWMVARVPVPASRAVKLKLRYLAELLGWSMIDPVEEAPLVLTTVADVAHRMMVGVQIEIVARIRLRADELRGSDEHDDLIAAAELDDLAADLEDDVLDEDEEEDSPCT